MLRLFPRRTAATCAALVLASAAALPAAARDVATAGAPGAEPSRAAPGAPFVLGQWLREAPGRELAALAEERILFARTPHMAGNRITFAYADDIWVANADGTNARRLTAHIARETNPRFSPDGQWIAFSSNRNGNYDVFIVPVTGGEPTQLTWHSASDEVQGWTPDGRGVVFSTSRGANPWGTPLHIVSVDGGMPRPMGMDNASAGMIRQDGAMVAFNRNGFRYNRQGYRGNASADVYVQDLRTGAIRQLTDTDIRQFRDFVHDAHPMWGNDGRIYYASERSGVFNIWRMNADGSGAEQVTRHAAPGVRFPAISTDGRTITYENAYEVWAVDVAGGEPRRIPVALAFDAKDNAVEFIRTSNRAEGFAPSPDGQTVAVDFRGEIFLVPAEPDFGEMRQVTRSAWRDRSQVWSPDGRRIAWISDESLDEEIWIYDVAAGERRQLTTHESVKSNLTWAPDSRRIAFVAANRLFEADVTSGAVTELAFNRAGGYAGIDYSADGRWLVYHRGDDDLNTDVYLFEIATRREHNVTHDVFRASNGTLTRDGRTLVFTSSRDNGTNHLFAVSLAQLREDPDDPLVRARLRDARESRDTAAAGPSNLNTDGIHRRAVQLTRGTNGVGSYFLSRDGRTIYFTSSDGDGAGLFAIGVDGRDRRRVVAGSFPGLTPTHDRRFVFYTQASTAGPGSEVHRMALASPNRRERVNFAFTVAVDRRAEWEQIFEESWRVMKYRFYDEAMHGRDWDAVKAQYKPLLAFASANEDVYDIANNMIGELNASHTGVSGPSSFSPESGYRTVHPGFELESSNGRYRVSHIYRDGPADREWLGLRVGDYVMAIDGQEVRDGDNYWRILNHTLNDYVPVRVARSANGDGARTVRVRTVNSIADLRYEEWVAKNREYVERESNGQIAYVHIRSMNQPSLERFRNEINQFWNAKGIVVDIRYNGGGNIDQELIDILERRPYEYWNNRWSAPEAGRRPRQAIAGPKVMLINFRSGSDSEVTPQGFRDLELGRIVGNPTAAAVIATGSYGLINGGSIRTPGSLVVTYDPTQPYNRGINLENFGVAPDVWAVNTPEDELRGFDRELKAAVDEALRMLAEGLWQFDPDRAGRVPPQLRTIRNP
jgi:tricorn protease